MANAEKVAAVAELTERFKDSSGAVLTEYRGLTVAQLAELRRSLGDHATFAVVKNTLTKIAVNEAGRGFGLSAGSLVGFAARALGGNGGGKPDVAQGGGAPLSNPGVIDEAFDAVRQALRDIAGQSRVR